MWHLEVAICSLRRMKWWQRLQIERKTRNLSVEDLAEKTGIPVKSVYGYLSGKVKEPGPGIVELLANAVGLAEQKLRFEENGARVVDTSTIPLLKLNKLGTLQRSQHPLSVWDGHSVIKTGDDIGSNAFAAVIEDDSGFPAFENGDTIIFDESAPAPGKHALVVLEKQKVAVVRRYKPAKFGDDTEFELIPVNDLYPKIQVNEANPGRIIGRAIAFQRSLL